jgi:type I restriction enzyme R subunit
MTDVKPILDWKKKQQTRAGVKLTIKKELDFLPEVYSKEIYNQKCDLVYKYVYDMKTPAHQYVL